MLGLFWKSTLNLKGSLALRYQDLMFMEPSSKNACFQQYTEAMGWLRLVGTLKLHVSFAKEPYTRDDILQKRPLILRSLIIVATPYNILPPHTSATLCVAVCCSVLQCVAVCCSVLQCVAVSCSVLKRVAVSCSELQ